MSTPKCPNCIDITKAASQGHLACLQTFRVINQPIMRIAHAINEASLQENTECLHFLIDTLVANHYGLQDLGNIMQYLTVEAVRYALKDKIELFPERYKSYWLAYAAREGKVDVLKLLHKDFDISISPNTAAGAVIWDQLNSVEYIKSVGGPKANVLTFFQCCYTDAMQKLVQAIRWDFFTYTVTDELVEGCVKKLTANDLVEYRELRELVQAIAAVSGSTKLKELLAPALQYIASVEDVVLEASHLPNDVVKYEIVAFL